MWIENRVWVQKEDRLGGTRWRKHKQGPDYKRPGHPCLKNWSPILNRIGRL